MDTAQTPKDIHKITSKKTGKAYEVRKMRTAESFNLPIYHYRRLGASEWHALHGADKLAQAREQLNGFITRSASARPTMNRYVTRYFSYHLCERHYQDEELTSFFIDYKDEDGRVRIVASPLSSFRQWERFVTALARGLDEVAAVRAIDNDAFQVRGPQ